MRDSEATRQAEDALFKKAAREVHGQGMAWFSLLDVAAQIAVENKRIRGEQSLGDRALRFFGVNRAQPESATTIDSGLYAIAGRLQDDGSLEARRNADSLETNSHMYRLIEEPEALAA